MSERADSGQGFEADLYGQPRRPRVPGGIREIHISGWSNEEGPPFAAGWNSAGDRVAAGFSDVRTLVAAFGHAAAAELRHIPIEAGTALAWRPGSSELAGTHDGRLRIWQDESSSWVDIDIDVDRMSYISWAPNGWLISVSTGGGTDVYDMPAFADVGSGAPRKLLSMRDLPLVRVSWAADSSTFFSLAEKKLSCFDMDGVLKWNSQEFSGLFAEQISLSIDDSYVAVATQNSVISIFDVRARRVVAELSSHTGPVVATAFSPDGRMFASLSWDNTIRLWLVPDWYLVGKIEMFGQANMRRTNWAQLAFHPTLPILAGPSSIVSGLSCYELDLPALLAASSATQMRRYATAKIVLVGESGVGKTGLAYRLATGAYKEHSSTHGQQFWLADALSTTRSDGVRCEVILWDLAGQPDYRLIHVLFLDDADAALVVFDPSRRHESLDAASFWLKALKRTNVTECVNFLVAARTDRGNTAFTPQEMDAFATSSGVPGRYVETSALTGNGIDDLVAALRSAVPWDQLTLTVETPVLTAIKEETLALKEAQSADRPIVTVDEIRALLDRRGLASDATEQAVWSSLRDLQLHGFVQVLRTSSARRVTLLKPELLNNLAASLILEARRNERGLGALDEDRLGEGAYDFPELRQLLAGQPQILLESVIALLLEHNVCFRESLGDQRLLIFPELINEKPPTLSAAPPDLVDNVTYVISGDIANVYASLVVLLGYTNVLRRVDQWFNRAQYDFDGHFLQFRQVRPTDDQLEIILSHRPGAPHGVRRVFEGLVEQFLRRRPVTVRRYPRVECPDCGFVLPRSQVIQFLDDQAEVTYCPRGGHPIPLGAMAPPSEALSDAENSTLRREADTAASRTLFSVTMTQFNAFVASAGRVPAIGCFVSYPWGDREVETWVRNVLTPDLRQAGIDVLLDVHVNRVGDNLVRFVERIEDVQFVVVVGTPQYLEKYNNALTETGTVVAAEADLINRRLLGTEVQKSTVLPILRRGSTDLSLPPIMRTRISGDFREEAGYFPRVFDLILALHRVELSHPVVQELRTLLEDSR
jgi:small GTP-binding protein